jgi:hypothetical protein
VDQLGAPIFAAALAVLIAVVVAVRVITAHRHSTSPEEAPADLPD